MPAKAEEDGRNAARDHDDRHRAGAAGRDDARLRARSYRRAAEAKEAPQEVRPSGIATLADLAAAYATQMENDGKSNGTIASYGMELKLAQDEIGAETPLADLTPERVETFFNCKRVTKLRSGKQKSQLSIDKTRRVLRLALVWAAERGIIERAPLPEPTEAK
jgi:hypothetical protein